MSYDETRDSEQLRHLDVAIAEFILRYQSNSATSGRQTAILFPGGMACELLRARTPYDDNGGPGQTFHYDTVWLDAFTFLGNALTLAMHKQGGSFRDLDDRIVIANGSVEFLGGTPYDGFTAWCDLQGIDWFVFGWDWRRRIEDIADFCVTQFLPRFQQAMLAANLPDPLMDFTIVGHSFGGMVVNLVNRRTDAILDGMQHVITAGAPFYGYGGQIHRWFEGESLLNDLGKLAVIRVIASFPGVYTLGFLDADTFLANQAALADDHDFPLLAYPSMDADNPALQADPFNPPTAGPALRYPVDIGFDMHELAHAREIYQATAQPMPEDVQDRFFCIRGVRPAADTAGAITWKLIDASYNPQISGTRIANDAAVPGDDTQPAWTARLVTQPAAQIVTIRAELDHAFMMESPEVLAAIGAIMGVPETVLLAVEERREIPPRKPQSVSSDEALGIIRGLQERRTPERPMLDKPTVDAYLEQFPLGKLRAVARRVIQDILKRPNTPREAAPPREPDVLP